VLPDSGGKSIISITDRFRARLFDPRVETMKAFFGTLAAVVLGIAAVLGIAYFAERHEFAPTTEIATPPATEAAEEQLPIGKYDDRRSVAEMLAHPVHPAVRRATIATLLHETGVQIGVAVAVDSEAAKEIGIDLDKATTVELPSEPGRSRLTALLHQADADDRLKLAVRVDRRSQLEFVVTTKEAAERNGMTLVPQALLAAADTSRRQVAETKTGAEAMRPKAPARIALASSTDIVAKRKAAFDQSFDGRLYFLAERLGMKLRIDRDRLYKSRIHASRGFPVSATNPAIEELKSFLAKCDSQLSYAILRDAEGRQTLVITTTAVVAKLGPEPTLEKLIALHPFGGLSDPIRPDTDMLLFAQSLREPIRGKITELPFTKAIAEIAKQSGIAIRIEREDLEAEGLTVTGPVVFDPRGREARAVLYDVLLQIDPERRYRAIYCFEKAESEKFSLLITTRDTARRTGRSVPSDLSMESDDI